MKIGYSVSLPLSSSEGTGIFWSRIVWPDLLWEGTTETFSFDGTKFCPNLPSLDSCRSQHTLDSCWGYQRSTTFVGDRRKNKGSQLFFCSFVPEVRISVFLWLRRMLDSLKTSSKRDKFEGLFLRRTGCRTMSEHYKIRLLGRFGTNLRAGHLWDFITYTQRVSVIQKLLNNAWYLLVMCLDPYEERRDYEKRKPRSKGYKLELVKRTVEFNLRRESENETS